MFINNDELIPNTTIENERMNASTIKEKDRRIRVRERIR